MKRGGALTLIACLALVAMVVVWGRMRRDEGGETAPPSPSRPDDQPEAPETPAGPVLRGFDGPETGRPASVDNATVQVIVDGPVAASTEFTVLAIASGGEILSRKSARVGQATQVVVPPGRVTFACLPLDRALRARVDCPVKVLDVPRGTTHVQLPVSMGAVELAVRAETEDGDPIPGVQVEVAMPAGDPLQGETDGRGVAAWGGLSDIAKLVRAESLNVVAHPSGLAVLPAEVDSDAAQGVGFRIPFRRATSSLIIMLPERPSAWLVERRSPRGHWVPSPKSLYFASLAGPRNGGDPWELATGPDASEGWYRITVIASSGTAYVGDVQLRAAELSRISLALLAADTAEIEVQGTARDSLKRVKVILVFRAEGDARMEVGALLDVTPQRTLSVPRIPGLERLRLTLPPHDTGDGAALVLSPTVLDLNSRGRLVLWCEWGGRLVVVGSLGSRVPEGISARVVSFEEESREAPRKPHPVSLAKTSDDPPTWSSDAGPPGTWEVTIRYASESAHETVVVRAGDQQELGLPR